MSAFNRAHKISDLICCDFNTIRQWPKTHSIHLVLYYHNCCTITTNKPISVTVILAQSDSGQKLTAYTSCCTIATVVPSQQFKPISVTVILVHADCGQKLTAHTSCCISTTVVPSQQVNRLNYCDSGPIRQWPKAHSIHLVLYYHNCCTITTNKPISVTVILAQSDSSQKLTAYTSCCTITTVVPSQQVIQFQLP